MAATLFASTSTSKQQFCVGFEQSTRRLPRRLATVQVLAKRGDARPPAAISLRSRPVETENDSQTLPAALLQRPPVAADASTAGGAAADEEAVRAAVWRLDRLAPPAWLPQLSGSALSQLTASEWWPKLCLLASAAMWGSYAPAVRLLYQSPGGAPDVAVVMAVRGVLQASVLLFVCLALQPPSNEAEAGSSSSSADVASCNSSAGSSSSSSMDSRAAAVLPGGGADLLRQWLHLESPPLWMAALELGLWNFSATALQTLSLQLISATRASFLVQATLLLTPLLSAASGHRPSRNVWAGCALALAGCLLITADEAAADVATGSWDSAGLSLGGDSAILAAAVFYSLGVVRIAGYARRLPSVQLATGKSLVLGGLAFASLAVAASGVAAEGQPLSTLWGGYSDPLSWVALAWVGLGPGAIGSYLHIQGQKRVAPAQAQVIFSSKPLFSAGLAWFLLGGEQLGPMTWVGGATLVVASLIASSGDSQQAQQTSGKQQ